ALHVLALARLDRDDLALIQERIAHRDRLIEQAARIVPQVEDVALELGAGFVLDLLDGLDDARGALLGERSDADVADIAFHAPARWTDLDDLAGQRDVERILGAATDRNLDGRAGLAAQLLDCFLEGEALHRLAVERDDEVAGPQAGPGRRRLVDRRHH